MQCCARHGFRWWWCLAAFVSRLCVFFAFQAHSCDVFLECAFVVGYPPDLPLVSAGSDMIRWSRVLLSHTLDAARSY